MRSEVSEMAGGHLFIRIDFRTGHSIGPDKIKLLEAIGSARSITGAARLIGMSYSRAWWLVEEINRSLREPAVTTGIGGVGGGHAVVTPVGRRVVGLYHAIELQARTAVEGECRAIGELVRQE